MGNFDHSNNSLQSPSCSGKKVQVVGLSHKSRSERLRDPFIVDRVNQYLNDNRNLAFVEINDMVDALRRRHKEYRRRNWGQFKILVERGFTPTKLGNKLWFSETFDVALGQDKKRHGKIKKWHCGQLANPYISPQNGVAIAIAFKVVSKRVEDNGEQLSDSSSSEIEECNDSDEGKVNTSNAQMQSLYSSPAPDKAMANATATDDGALLIDLSSDEDQGRGGNAHYSVITTATSTPHPHTSSAYHNHMHTGDEERNGGDLKTPRTSQFAGSSASPSRRRGLASSAKKRVTGSRNDPAITPQHHPARFSDFGGNPQVLEEVCKLILHLKHPEVFKSLGISAPRGFLLHGPPGCGKSLLAAAIAGELGVPLIKVSGPELVGGVSGESEERVRELFSSAVECSPCVLFIDEVDAVTPNRQTAQREMERRIVAQLITSLDDLATKDEAGQVLVVGATKRPDALDPALRRAGRFDREVCLGIPNEKARLQILEVVCKPVKLSPSLNLAALARLTPGFVGADLVSLVREAALVAISRLFHDIQVDIVEKDSRKRKRAIEEDVEVKAKRPAEEGAKKKSADAVKKSEEEAVKKSEETVKNSEETAKKTDEEKIDEVLVEEKEEEKKSDEPMPLLDDPEEEAPKIEENGKLEIEPEKAEGEVVVEEAVIVKESVVEEEKVPLIEEIPKPATSTLNSLLQWLREASALDSTQLAKFSIEQSDMDAALKCVQPSAKREGFATVPDVTWDDVGSLVDVRDHLKMTILGPIKYQSQFERLGLVAPAGVLLCGPPGCGKTLLAKAVANEAGINFISVKGPELLNMYVGESERAVRTVFQRARNSAPCVIFFDELDALCPRRTEGDAGAGVRVVNQMLTEMDGVGERRGVFLMAATNRPDIVDPAVLRPGRLDRIVYIGMPNASDRRDILIALTKNGTKPPLEKDVSLSELAARPELENWTGADLASLMREAALEAVREAISADAGSADSPPQSLATDVFVSAKHLEAALKTVRPSVSPKDLIKYEEMRLQYVAKPAL